tara:strand:+ start:752 stop:1165 length:414 start_codon:yes stop_codon:yes gene_type:complete
MIGFYFQTKFTLKSRKKIKNWLYHISTSENFKIGKLTYVFCDNDFLLQINQKYLKHDYYTDVITFDYSNQKEINGDILISVEQVTLNSKKYNESKLDELYRVMAHGLLHLIGYDDKNKKDKKIMSEKESFYLKMIIH